MLEASGKYKSLSLFLTLLCEINATCFICHHYYALKYGYKTIFVFFDLATLMVNFTFKLLENNRNVGWKELNLSIRLLLWICQSFCHALVLGLFHGKMLYSRSHLSNLFCPGKKNEIAVNLLLHGEIIWEPIWEYG